MEGALNIRNLKADDHPPVISQIPLWWGGRDLSQLLPKLFFIHFQQTSFVVEEQGELIAFLVGFLSQTFPDQAYIHFVGVHPDYRGRGIARDLYSRFFETVKQYDRKEVHCLTSLVNKDSIAFHQRLGFEFMPAPQQSNGIPYVANYDGKGGDRVLFVKYL
ncbi:MAG: GNAT family N-acetyltransferase [Gammaproteobacteria bacterium]|nr:GNAT family N-acetyltransferase [Gammaproteobacteria bacterium]